MLQEDTQFRVGLRINGGLEDRHEDILQNLPKVRHKVPGSENVTG